MTELFSIDKYLFILGNRGRINRSNNLRDVGQFNPTGKINKPCFSQIKAINNQQRSGSFTPIQSTFMSYE